MQKAQEDVIHPLRSTHAESPRQQSMKPRKRHSRPLKLTGEVNLGTKNFKAERKHRQRARPAATKSVNTIDETVTDAGRHHHHNSELPNEIPALEVIETSTAQAATEAPFVEETTQPKFEKSETKAKLDEKAHRRERLKQKLAALTPEERQAFLLMKQQRAEAKKKGLNYTHWTVKAQQTFTYFNNFLMNWIFRIYCKVFIRLKMPKRAFTSLKVKTFRRQFKESFKRVRYDRTTRTRRWTKKSL